MSVYDRGRTENYHSGTASPEILVRDTIYKIVLFPGITWVSGPELTVRVYEGRSGATNCRTAEGEEACMAP